VPSFALRAEKDAVALAWPPIVLLSVNLDRGAVDRTDVAQPDLQASRGPVGEAAIGGQRAQLCGLELRHNVECGVVDIDREQPAASLLGYDAAVDRELLRQKRQKGDKVPFGAAVGQDDHRAGKDLRTTPGLADALGCLGLVGAPVGDDAADHAERDEQKQCQQAEHRCAGQEVVARKERGELPSGLRRWIGFRRRRRDVGHRYLQEWTVQMVRRWRATAVQRLWRFGANAARAVDRGGADARLVPMQKVLVVDDDPHIRDVVCFALRRAGYQPLPADNGLAALELAAREGPALVVLDILMPELDGAEVCKRLRKASDVPIIFLTSKDEEMDLILGLELGADDYVVKPFSPRELVARVKTVLRRKGPEVTAEQRLVRGRLVVDLEAIAASWDGAAVTLTATEFALLKAIAAQPHRVFTRENLMTASYVGARFVSDRTIDSHVRHIRAKFQSVGGDPIETVHGVGYRLAAT